MNLIEMGGGLGSSFISCLGTIIKLWISSGNEKIT